MNKQLTEAIQLIESGFHEEGLEKVERLVQYADDELKRTIAELYYELGLIDKALVVIEELMYSYPDHGELFVFAAECYSEMGREDEAVDMLTEIGKNDAAYIQAQLLLADIYQNQGLEEVAEQKLLHAVALQPDEPVLQYGLGEFYLSRGDYQQAIPYFKKMIYQNRPVEVDGLNPHLRLAEAYSLTGQFEDALSCYQQGIAKKEELDGLFGYGYTALQVKDYETAVKQLSRLKELDPDYTTLFPYLGRAHRALRQNDEAVKVLTEGLAKDEYNEELYFEMAKAQFSLGKMEEGKTYLEKVIAINPSNLSAVKELLLFFHENEQYDEVLELLAFLEAYGEYDPLFERYKGKALYEADNLAGAAKAYEQALLDMPDEEELLEEAGYVFLESGDKVRGVECLKTLLTLQPDRSDIAERLERLQAE
ncbi:Tetratricopeptide repeat-containing protein [Evansella caseinilytica]|uniref:Tetratricopeptide repeat-containing protein n=1 Tax=Evansella caseinilytica TaxID=1503961 RepID=A0A1H3NF60_9BACI|nr:tetratricopeptide repeat protein [Evansella caseinilytica]SDY87581.1 Tetratricopeptide repeat-containing protein [Evansella caseinilytica]